MSEKDEKPVHIAHYWSETTNAAGPWFIFELCRNYIVVRRQARLEAAFYCCAPVFAPETLHFAVGCSPIEISCKGRSTQIPIYILCEESIAPQT